MQGFIRTDPVAKEEADLSGLNLTEEAPVPETGSGGDAAEDSTSQDNLIRLVEYLKKKKGRKALPDAHISQALSAYDRTQLGYVKPSGSQFDREG